MCVYVICEQKLKRERDKMRMQSRRHFVQDFSFTSTASRYSQPSDSHVGPEKSLSDLSTVVAKHDRRNVSSSSAPGGVFAFDSGIFDRPESAPSSSNSDSVSATMVDTEWISLQYDESTFSVDPDNYGRHAPRDTDIFTDVHTRSRRSPHPSSNDKGTENYRDAARDFLESSYQTSSSSTSDESVGQLVRRIQEKAAGTMSRVSQYSSPSSAG